MMYAKLQASVMQASGTLMQASGTNMPQQLKAKHHNQLCPNFKMLVKSVDMK